jgi:hypothetical protein
MRLCVGRPAPGTLGSTPETVPSADGGTFITTERLIESVMRVDADGDQPAAQLAVATHDDAPAYASFCKPAPHQSGQRNHKGNGGY